MNNVNNVEEIQVENHKQIEYQDKKGNRKHDYDLIVVGGGSGGLACSKEASDLGKKVAVLDYVEPSYQGTSWGLGGTCVNVGCIPKKLMHQASLLGEAVKDSKKYGWDIPDSVKLNWSVEYVNGHGSFVDSNIVKAVMRNGKERLLSADNIVIAVGGRPRFPDIPGAKDYCISSDDLFWLKRPPGFDTTVMVRSILLRGFDQQMANLIGDNMQGHGVKFIKNSAPKRIERLSDGRLEVFYDSFQWGEEHSDIFDTVMLATGRDPVTNHLALQNAGIETDKETGYIICGDDEQTSATNVYAIGDVILDRPELTPVAIMAGKLLARRLFSDSTILMDYAKVPTTVFTPLEYSSVGLSEEKADAIYGHDNIEVYHAFYKPLEFTLSERDVNQCYMKIICKLEGDQEVLGIHFLGPNAGEVMQGANISYKDLSHTVGIHPTCAEEIVKMHISKRSGLDPHVSAC
eukprot:gene12237-13498_t